MSIASVETFASGSGLDKDLLARARVQDPAVWSAWHNEHYLFLYRYALSRLGSREDAEDVASQVFLEALKGIDRFRDQGRPILAWFYGIAQHLVSKRLRQSGRFGDHLLTDDFSHKLAPAVDDEIVDRVYLHSGLARLKPEHREVLILRFLLDRPTEEVARLLRKTEAATYSLQVRALTALRRELSR